MLDRYNVSSRQDLGNFISIISMPL